MAYKQNNIQIPFNGIACNENETLAPVLLYGSMEQLLLSRGLNYDNVRTWHFKYASEPVPVAFIQVDKNQLDVTVKCFNHDVNTYLSRHKDNKEVSLDEILEKLESDDESAVDPTGTTKYDDTYKYLSLVADLIDGLTAIDQKSAAIIKFILCGYTNKDLLHLGSPDEQECFTSELLGLNFNEEEISILRRESCKKKTQQYDDFKKARAAANEFISGNIISR